MKKGSLVVYRIYSEITGPSLVTDWQWSTASYLLWQLPYNRIFKFREFPEFLQLHENIFHIKGRRYVIKGAVPHPASTFVPYAHAGYGTSFMMALFKYSLSATQA